MITANLQRVLRHTPMLPARRPFALRSTAMIDMVFLLLIFFLVSAKWRPAEDFLPLQLPAAQAYSHSAVKPEPLVISIFETQTGCQVRLAQFEHIDITEENLQADLAALLRQINTVLSSQKRTASDPVELVCAARVKWDHVAKIYNCLCGAGLTDITFIMTE